MSAGKHGLGGIRQIARLARSVLGARLARWGLSPPPRPINVTFSVTTRCQSRCRTCLIWKHPPRPELSIAEIEGLLGSIGWTYFFNISGGEPYLRDDLPDIVGAACRILDPAVIHIPTNALMPRRIGELTQRCLEQMSRCGSGATLTVKPSFDGVGSLHDEIRGVPGNFEKLCETMDVLLGLAKLSTSLQVGLGTVVSTLNIDRLQEIIDYAASRWNVSTYINEIAEERSEFHNTGTGITPSGPDYRGVMEIFKSSVRSELRGMGLLSRLTTAMRIVYYDLAPRIVSEGSQAIPCYAGLLNVHINSDGDIWPCAVLGYEGSMGTVGRDGSFGEIWRSLQARDRRRSIRRGECACPLANQAYSNILMSPLSLARALMIAVLGR
ncbi:radical SAM protein [Candidatus Fermentibacterales bacterium]|nr:radical SAM protein [Candidatus Fermentibacterales bacterium]